MSILGGGGSEAIFAYLRGVHNMGKPAYLIFAYSLRRKLIDLKTKKAICCRDVRDQFLHVETETETQCSQSQFLILRLRLLKLVSNFETATETL